MIYLLVFLLCFLVDRLKNHSCQKIAFICFIGVVLCFGYTTGTDWRNYEVAYYNPYMDIFLGWEPGFMALVHFFRKLDIDFWIFNALCKIFYLWSLTYLLSFFTNKIWSTVAFTLVFSTIFLVVNCPMRFMLSMAIFYIGVGLFIQKKIIIASLIGLIALSFHITIIIPILLFISGIIINEKFFNLHRYQLVILTFLALFVSTFVGLYQFLFNNLLSILNLDGLSGAYGFFKKNALLNFGVLRNCLLCFIIIYYKEVFRSIKYGRLIFYYAVSFFWLDVLFHPIPTAFRLALFNSQFASIAIVLLLFLKIGRWHIINIYLQKGIYFLFAILLLKSVYSSYAYYPYTNSIRYILTGHMSYQERADYNIRIFTRDIGPVKGVQRNNGEELL